MAAAVEYNDLQKVEGSVVLPRCRDPSSKNPRLSRFRGDFGRKMTSVFADIFTFPQPPSSDMETMEGVPVVTVHDDPAEMEIFLKAIFDSEFFMPPPAENKFDDVLGILRLAHKYDVPYLRRRALEHLGPIYPTRLSKYDCRPNADALSENFLRAIATIATAREVDAPWLLPVAYYDICKCELSSVIKNRHWLNLEEEERNTCLVGYAAQVQQFPKIFNFLFLSRGADDDCEDWARCNKSRLETGFIINPRLSPAMNVPLYINLDPVWAALSLNTCGSCVTESKRLHAAAREDCWGQLPKTFGLPGWNELEEMRRLALSA